MKILSIKGKNLASIEGDFALDFTVKPLSTAGIFAITGITGAGKSTILDALCLALYARTPRQKAAKENTVKVKDGKSGLLSQGDPRLIMRKGCYEAIAEVSFVGVDSNPYSAMWSVRRARGHAQGQMQDYSVALFNLSTGQPFPGKKVEVMKETERLVGMNFDQFTRSVLLAQGEFTAFLKADQNEKSELLEKLTGTDVYSRISALVHIKTKEAEQKVKEVELKLLDLKLLSEEEVTFLSHELSSIKSEISSLKVEHQELVRQLDWCKTLDRLKIDLDESAIILKQTIEARDASSSRHSYLTKVEGIQDARSLVQHKNSCFNSLQQKLTSLETTLQQLESIKENILINKYKLSAAESLYLNAVQKYTDAKEDLLKARELDTQITSTKKNLDTLSSECSLLINKLKETDYELNETTIKHKDISESIKDINDWLSKNELRRPIAENINIILSKLKEASTNLVRKSSFQTRIEESTRVINSTREEILLLEKNLDDMVEKYEFISRQVKEHQEAIESKDPLTLERNIESSNALLKELTALLHNLDKQLQLKSLYQDTEEKLKRNSTKITDTETNLEQALSNLSTAEIKRTQTEKMLIDAKLRASDNVIELRNNLKPDEPCTVCGSLNHPYAIQNEKLHSILESIENEYRMCDEEHKNLFKLHLSLSSDKKYLYQEKENLTQQITNYNEALSQLVNDYISLEGYQRFESIPEKSRHEALKQEYTNIEINLIEFTSTLANVRKQTSELETLMIELTSLSESISLLKDVLAKKNNLVSLHQQQKDIAKQEFDVCFKNINLIEEEIGVWFSKEGWSTAWRIDPTKFINELTSFSESWVEKISALTDKERLFHNLSIQLKALRELMAERKIELDRKESQLANIENEYKELNHQRTTFFNGKSCSEVEKELVDNETEAKKAFEQSKLISEKLGSEYDTLKGALTQLENDKIQSSAALYEASVMLDNWLLEYNKNGLDCLNEITLQELLEITPSWIRQERLELSILADNVLKALATHDERSEQLVKHEATRYSVLSIEELNNTLETLVAKIEELTKSETALTVKLIQDDQNKKQSSSYLNEIDKRNDSLVRWKKLDDIIGSADGKKFRQIAQKYTLEVLLGFANKHLQSLSPRYHLQCVPETLALQVIDHDMGDEIRSVHYLSGGESFLVSLALALGLASLSSNRMKVESLFIDEGFGSLDPITLRTAMDALERLHNDGRKVGVISHVQEMTDRIPVQVQVIKLAGKSKVEIKG